VLLFVPQGFDRIQLGGLVGGEKAEEHADREADPEGDGD
jgi:hypothetical protein